MLRSIKICIRSSVVQLLQGRQLVLSQDLNGKSSSWHSCLDVGEYAKVIALTGPQKSLDSSQLSPLNIGDESPNLSRSIQMLGCYLDSHMTFKPYIINIAKYCLSKLRNMHVVRRCISTNGSNYDRLQAWLLHCDPLRTTSIKPQLATKDAKHRGKIH